MNQRRLSHRVCEVHVRAVFSQELYTVVMPAHTRHLQRRVLVLLRREFQVDGGAFQQHFEHLEPAEERGAG